MSKFGDFMQGFFTATPGRTLWFSRTMPAPFWERQGRKRVVETFHWSISKVPAYRQFLQEYGFTDPQRIRTFDDFAARVPITSKETYISHYSAEELLSAPIDQMYTFATSSGTSGHPTQWFRTYAQDSRLARFMGPFYRNIWQIGTKKTLFVNSMALGNWAAGQLVNVALMNVAADPSSKLTLATPGANVDQVLSVIKMAAHQYDLVIIAGFPTFVKLLLESGAEHGIDWRKINVRLHVGGEAVSENWRRVVADLLIPRGDTERLDLIVDTYGSADAGGMGFGTPLTNLVRILARENQDLATRLFGRPEIPTLVQFNPLGYFMESLPNGHIAMTYRSAVPLVRYDIGDIGGILSFPTAMEALREGGYDVPTLLRKGGVSSEFSIWRFPFVYVYFRESSLSVASATIYPSIIAEVVDQIPELHGFKITKREDSQGNQRFVIFLEQKKGRSAHSEGIVKQYHDRILEHLRRKNAEFNQAYAENPEICDPHVELHVFRNGPFAGDANRTKPKLVV